MMRQADHNDHRQPRRSLGRAVVPGLLALCVSAWACKDEGVGLGDTTMPPTTGPGTDSADDVLDDNPDDDPDDGMEDPDDGTSSSEGGETTVVDSMGGTDSSGGESTGCMTGTEGCPCASNDPPCEDDLLCINDVCAAPLCPGDTEEPGNDDPFTPFHVGDFTDGDPGGSIISQLSGSDDVDWWSYNCADTVLEEVEPSRVITQPSPLRVCKYLDCVVGGNPIFDCPAGTEPDDAPFGFVEGCCVTDGSSFDLTDFNCPTSSDESVTVYIKVDQSEVNNCVEYQIDFAC